MDRKYGPSPSVTGRAVKLYAFLPFHEMTLFTSLQLRSGTQTEYRLVEVKEGVEMDRSGKRILITVWLQSLTNHSE